VKAGCISPGIAKIAKIARIAMISIARGISAVEIAP
jgi:hypothetical protein